MLTFSDKQIDDIAQELDCGMIAYIHKKTGECLYIPDELKMPDFDPFYWKDQIKKLEKKPFDYLEINGWSSGLAFDVMLDFAERIADNNQLRQKLLTALQNKKPFRGFSEIIDNSGDYRNQWFKFKNMKYMEYVRQNLEFLTDCE